MDIVARAEGAQGAAHVIAHTAATVAADRLGKIRFRELVFARQGVITLPDPVRLEGRDRVAPLISAAQQLARHYSLAGFQSVWIEYPDTNDGKSLSSLARGLAPFLESSLREHSLLNEAAVNTLRMHVFLTSKQSAWIGWSRPGYSADWPLGIPRLRMPAGAPSRSTLKLAEAIATFLGKDEDRLLKPDMRAVDLGAAPGGWTWQLINRGLHVTAVDNANLRGDLVDNALVKHLRADGFHFHPKRPVDWLVCDMVEKPSRIAQLVAEWLAHGWAQHAIFNLKLPMKKRFDELNRCASLLRERLHPLRLGRTIEFKQLYHDREEVTGFCSNAKK